MAQAFSLIPLGGCSLLPARSMHHKLAQSRQQYHGCCSMKLAEMTLSGLEPPPALADMLRRHSDAAWGD